MSALHNVRLPASELAKLRPSRPAGPAPRRPRPAHHLSGFART